MKETRGRKFGSVIVLDNTECKEYLKEYGLSIYDWNSFQTYCPDWLDDILEGAGCQMTGTRTPSPYQIFMKLAHLDEISTITVGKIFTAYSASYIKQWTNVLKCASQAVLYHKVGKASFTINTNEPVYHEPPKPEKLYWFNGEYYSKADYDKIDQETYVVTYCGKSVLVKDLHKDIMSCIK